MPLKRIRNIINEFIKMESAGGILLFVMAILAIAIENSPWSPGYNALLHVHLSLKVGAFGIDESFQHWVNDGLMAIFFFLVGLEIKREFLEGELSSFDKAILPAIAAIGGMVVPALIYVAFNHSQTGEAMRGWAIPTATDIAFALGILSLLGSRIPTSVKIFLTALAILDDLGAILIIAIFYTAQINYAALSVAGVCIIALIALNRCKVSAFNPYLIIGGILWVAVLKSGVHATFAGVILAMTIPLRSTRDPDYSPLRELEHAVLPWVAFVIMPVFAFANAGVSLAGIHWGVISHSIPIGIALGLFVGKQVGVFGASWLAIKSGVAKMPTNGTLSQIYGVALLCGIGFTMSLFIGGLAFGAHKDYATMLRLGVFMGSIVSGVAGYVLLFCLSKKNTATAEIA